MKTLITAKIRCINRKSKQLFDREYWTELSSLPEPQRQTVEAISGGAIRAADFIEIRPLLNDAEFAACPHPAEFDCGKFLSVDDYFEDESGTSLDEVDMAQIITGDEFPVILHNVKSVLRLGPAPILRKDQWSVESANTIAHFLQLVETIGTSAWMKMDSKIATAGPPDAPAPVTAFRCPDLASTYAVLLPMRQLYASDHAFNHACDQYMRFVDDDRKRAWIAATRNSFNGYLASVPRPFSVGQRTVQELLDLVMYGAGLVHYSKTDPRKREQFRELITQDRRERVIFTFVMCCRELYKQANHAYFVLRQDIERWVSTEGCAPPDLLFPQGLFRSHPLETTK